MVWTLLNRGYNISNSSQLRKKEFQKISNLFQNGFPLNYINWQIQSCRADKKLEKPKTDEKDDKKRIFMNLPYLTEMNGHTPKKINAFLKKLDFKVTFVLITKR